MTTLWNYDLDLYHIRKELGTHLWQELQGQECIYLVDFPCHNKLIVKIQSYSNS